jgi:hypothetical protein
MSDGFNHLSYKEKIFLIHIIGKIGADLQAKEGWTELRVKQTLDFSLIPGTFYGAYMSWPEEMREDIARIVNGEKPNQPLSILERAYENAFRVAEQRLAQLKATEAANVQATATAAPAPRATTTDDRRSFWLGVLVGAAATFAAAAVGYAFLLPH